MNSTSTTDHCIDVCNSLLRGERSAVETYDKAIEKFGDKQDLGALERIRNEHREAVIRLEGNVRSMGGTPDEESGAWGTFANAVQGAANLFGADSAIASLQKGEEHGRSEYCNALEDMHVMPECKNMILNELLPKTEQHIQQLEGLDGSA